MNTVQKGDKFENKSYQLIVDAIKNGELGILPSAARVLKKPKYYSRDRERDIIFDLSIEIWLQNAEKFSNLFLIECKSTSKKNVPVDDVEEFYTKIRQVADTNVKGIMITDKSFQKGGFKFAKNKNLMLMEVNEDSMKIVLHRSFTNSNLEENLSIDEKIEKLIRKALGGKKIIGLQQLSSSQIEEATKKIHLDYKGIEMPIQKEDFCNYIERKYNLKFSFDCVNQDQTKKILGCYSRKENTIFIYSNELLINQFSFVLGHELGHYFLHNNLLYNQELYDDFEDSEYNFFEDKHLLVNEKNWIEWQANKFAVSLFLPKDSFIYHFNSFRKELGIRNYKHIFLDNQDVNQNDYNRTINYLSEIFDISKTSVKFRIKELGLITHAENMQDMRSNIRNIFF